MTSTAIRSQSSTIARKDTTVSPNVYNTIPNIVGFPTPSPEAADLDVTDLSSTAREYLSGLEDNGELALTGFYNPNETEHALLQARVGSNTTDEYKITLADVSPQQQITFTARVKAFRVTLGVDEPVNMEIVLRVSGAATWS